MKDKTGRTIDYLRVSVTDRCNLRCRYCMPEKGIDVMSHEELLTLEEILAICKGMAELGVTRIKLTGGEPLVRKNVIWLAKQLGSLEGIEDVTLTTNGILLKQYAQVLKEAGVSAVNVSLDTLNPQRFAMLTRRDQFSRVMEGIFAAKRAGLSLKINCAVTGREILDEIDVMAAFSVDHQIPVRLIEMMPIGSGTQFQGMDNHQLLRHWKEHCPDLRPLPGVLGNGPAVYYEFANGRGRVGFISAVHNKFCNDCNRVRLTSDGFLKLCLARENGISLRDLIRRGAEDREWKPRVLETVFQKPEGHCFERLDCRQIQMSQIGG